MASASVHSYWQALPEEFRRQKDLDAARKAGTAPAALDEEGKAINPHIPQYIAQAPWYLDTGAPSLSHQRMPDYDRSSDKLDNWYDRGAKAGPAAKKYRKKQDCLERPRRRGAKFTNRDIAPDEVIQDVATGYDAKRDRWNGYDPGEHKRIYDEYAAVEAARQKLREEEIDKQTTTDLAAVRKVAKAGKEKGEERTTTLGAVTRRTRMRTSMRRLRMRWVRNGHEDPYYRPESANSGDTAKYLINLDPSSAYYDPKTRSMRDNPMKNVTPEEARFAGDNFLRHSGEAPTARGNDVHMNANPTQGQLLHQKFEHKKEKLKDINKSSILTKYGGEEYLEKAPKELLQGQTEEYVLKGKERAAAKSKYPEDVYINNHTAVWGSWYNAPSGDWGYACCHSTVHISYCTGIAGIEAAQASSAKQLLASSLVADASPPPESAPQTTGTAEDRKKKAEELFSKKRLGEGELALDQDRLVKAIQEEKKRKTRGGEEEDRFAKRQKGGQGGSHELSQEELEAYRMNRRMMEDPMANYVDTEA
ncbi:Pre-mRNA splicing Prp18-interacting factor-domain-containing protein [Fomitopsis serialis]|uniref:Pre-mRNA splicing Prp18-interacting factor-domain-containing protein n=1 Tax=Fomitopsis serialis TaxID=139415 RepID=UPI0020089A76|nr:Pre-mRNA splicing Prp18-interacting factor-domain-containing protein [Neoantrodia serialis]KAH9935314.1 Pre-mRNA splicing Prp18-interacting factor-domain-containing protein [Neoantrodia serialis]